MATHVHLVRHGHHSLLGRILCGRMPDVALDDLGCRQMASVAEMISAATPSALQSSPQRRALQSAAIVAARCGLPVEIVPAFDEIDMGAWTGTEFAALDPTIAGGAGMKNAVARNLQVERAWLRCRGGWSGTSNNSEPWEGQS